MLDDYRQKFTDFHTLTQRERFDYVTGRKAADESYVWWAELSDLFTPQAVAALRALHDDISADRPNARAALARLRAFAEIGRLQAQTRELSGEIASVERSASFSYGEGKMTLVQAEAQMTRTADAKARRELSLRAGDLVREANDLRAERVQRWHENAVNAGYASVLDILSQRRGIAYGDATAQLTLLLMLTERSARTAMAAWLPVAAGVRLDESDFNDVAFARQQPGSAVFFPSHRSAEMASSLCEGLGWRFEKQSNLQTAQIAQARTARLAMSLTLRVPAEVKLCAASNVEGAPYYQQFLRALAVAQHAAWTSSQQPYEIRVAGDHGVALAWSYLFSGLLRDPAFLLSQFGFAQSAKLRHALACGEMYAIRRDAVLWLYEQEVYAGKYTGTRKGDAAGQFVTLCAENLHLKTDEAEHWRSVAVPLRSADRLRARAFAAQFGEYLKTNFGSRWWATRQAGEMLVDLWNTGHRYTVEELAALIGLGSLSFDWLASAANAALEDKV